MAVSPCSWLMLKGDWWGPDSAILCNTTTGMVCKCWLLQLTLSLLLCAAICNAGACHRNRGLQQAQ